jgi:hypothetical protein
MSSAIMRAPEASVVVTSTILPHTPKRGLTMAIRALVVAAVVSLSSVGNAAAQDAPQLAGCAVFPADNIWNTRVDGLPVHPMSAAYMQSIGTSVGVHPDFGTVYDGAPNGIPFVTVSGDQSAVPVSFEYADESDPGPYPIPPDAPIEGGSNSTGDRHVLVVDRDNCVLYELFDAQPQPDGSWHAGSGAIFPLTSDQLRPASWTSADAAGLPMLPGLARYDEVAAGSIAHALRFTAKVTQRAYLWPARHYASRTTSATVPPMGTRLRLKASVDTRTSAKLIRSSCALCSSTA